MNQYTRRIMLMLGFAGLVAMSLPACVVRGQAAVRPGVVIVDEEPPPPRYVKVVPTKAGHIWVRGRWVRQNNRWVWRQGHFVSARSGYSYTAGRWERRGSRWHWTEGTWVKARAGATVRVRDNRPAPAPDYDEPDRVHARPGHADRAPARPGRADRVPARPGRADRAPARPAPSPYPTNAPPARRAERPGAKAGHVWQPGRHIWKAGKWEWEAGHWVSARAGFEWKPGHWEQRGNRYVWVDGEWVQTARVRDNRPKKDDKKGPDRVRARPGRSPR